MIKNKIIVNDDKIDTDAILRQQPTIHRPRKSFKTAMMLDEINEKMPSRLGSTDLSTFTPKMIDGSMMNSLLSDPGISSEESDMTDEECKEQ